jgi:nicotinamidase-related amidase
MVKETCDVRPRCTESVPAVEKVLKAARTSGVMIVYTLGAAGKQFVEALAPQGGEPTVQSGANKFINTNLDAILKDKGIKSVIVVGTLANGGVLHTASDAALRGYTVVVPVDGMSSPNASALYTEQYTAWHLANAPVFGGRVTLTRSDMIKF